MFTEYIPVNEDDLSRKSGATRDRIYQYLVKLSSMNIIRYIPGKKTSLVILREERLMRKALFISPENYLHVKEKYEDRLDKMVDFADSDDHCRTVMLLDYFGEEAEPCGTCDICRNRKNGTSGEFEKTISLIEEILKDKTVNLEELVNLSGIEEKTVIDAVRWLIDRNRVKRNPDNSLTLVERS
jgi:ATP-dependent DNA helicase RecQ